MKKTRWLLSGLLVLGVANSGLSAEIPFETHPLGLYDDIIWMHQRCTKNDVCKPADSIVAEGKWQNGGKEYRLLGDGKDFYWAWDRGAFAYVRTTGDFSITARIKSHQVIKTSQFAWDSPASLFGKYGLMVREKLEANSRMLSLLWDEYWNTCRNGIHGGCTKGQYGVSWIYRHTEGKLGDTGEKSVTPGVGLSDNTVPDANKMQDLFLRIERKNFRFALKFKYGANGTWNTVVPVSREGTANDNLVMHTQEVYVGLAMASGGANFECDAGKGCTKAHWRKKESATVFDNIAFEGQILGDATALQDGGRADASEGRILVRGRNLVLPAGDVKAHITLTTLSGKTVFTGQALEGGAGEGILSLPSEGRSGLYVARVGFGSEARSQLIHLP